MCRRGKQRSPIVPWIDLPVSAWELRAAQDYRSSLTPGPGRGRHLPGNGTRCSPSYFASSASSSAGRAAGAGSEIARGSLTTPRILARYEMAAREEGTVLRLSPSEEEDEEDEEAAAARRAQRFTLDPRVRFLGDRLRHALGFPEETWGQYLESEDHRQAVGDFLESTGPASLVFGFVAAGRLSASPEVRRDLRCPLPDLNLKSVSKTHQKSVTPVCTSSAENAVC